MKDKLLLNKREWLNPIGHEDTGAVSSRVEFHRNGIAADVSIWDCSKKISLSFCFFGERQAKQRLKKIDTLIKHLQDVKAALGEGYTLSCTVGHLDEAEEQDKKFKRNWEVTEDA